MKKSAILIAFAFILTSTWTYSQITEKPDTISSIEKASLLNEDVTKIIQKTTKYPMQAIQNKMQGDVILSLVINRDGKMEGLSIVSSPGMSLSESSIKAINLLDKEWKPATINGLPLDKKYKIIFMYRMYMESIPPSSSSRAERFLKKEKYEKALTQYNKAIEENKYDFKLFESRAKVKEFLGDTDGANEDYTVAIRLKNEIMSVVKIFVIGKTRVTTTRETIRY